MDPVRAAKIRERIQREMNSDDTVDYSYARSEPKVAWDAGEIDPVSAKTARIELRQRDPDGEWLPT